MERALIIGASGGIGQALGVALRDRGVAVTALSRRDDGLEIAHEASVASHLGALVPGFDLIIVASGALAVDGAAPEKALRQVTAQAMLDQFAVNTVGPAMALKYGLPLLRRDGRAVMAVLSARVGSIGDNRLGGWLSYRSAKAAVNQVVHTAAIELARSHKQAICVALHPGTVATPLTRAYLGRHPAVAPDAAAGHLLAVIDALGPAQSGGFFDWQGHAIPW